MDLLSHDGRHVERSSRRMDWRVEFKAAGEV